MGYATYLISNVANEKRKNNDFNAMDDIMYPEFIVGTKELLWLRLHRFKHSDKTEQIFKPSLPSIVFERPLSALKSEFATRIRDAKETFELHAMRLSSPKKLPLNRLKGSCQSV